MSAINGHKTNTYGQQSRPWLSASRQPNRLSRTARGVRAGRLLSSILLLAAFMLSGAAITSPQQTAAQERLPWKNRDNANDSRDAGNYDDSSYQPPIIRQPRQTPDYEPRTRAPEPAYDGRDYSRRAPASGAPAYDAPAYDAPAPRQRAPYRSEYADPPRSGPDARADYDNRYDDRDYRDGGRRDYDRGPSGSYSMDEIIKAGGNFFGSVSKGLASVIEHAFKRSGRPNGYILGEGAGGAFIAGLRYGEGTLYTKHAGRHRVYWQGPSIGYDAGAEGSKTMVLVYNLRRPSDIYHRFGGVDGSAYLVGGVGITFQKRKHVTLAPIRAGVGLRLGANVGYLKYTRRPTWNPF